MRERGPEKKDKPPVMIAKSGVASVSPQHHHHRGVVLQPIGGSGQNFWSPSVFSNY